MWQWGNIVIHAGSIKRENGHFLDEFVMMLRWWWQLPRSKWNLTSSDQSCLDPGLLEIPQGTKWLLTVECWRKYDQFYFFSIKLMFKASWSNEWARSKWWLQGWSVSTMFYWSGILSDDLHTEHDWVWGCKCWQVPTNLNLYRSSSARPSLS